MSLFEGRDLACLRGERSVFAGLSFALAPGGALLLTGPNGSGKSSLLRLMAGLLAPAAGSLLWDGAPVREDPEAHRARLHYVGHLNAIKTDLTAAENLAFWASGRGTGPEGGPNAGSDTNSAARLAVGTALERFALAPLADVAARLLSAGQRRRLALARLLTGTAELWLLDEPTVGLDESSLGRLQAILAAHRETGGRIVAATHTALELPGAERLDLTDYPPAALELEPW